MKKYVELPCEDMRTLGYFNGQSIIFDGYETGGIFTSVYNNKLYLGCLRPEWDMMVNIYWFYI